MGSSNSTISDRIEYNDSYVKEHENYSRWMTNNKDLLKNKLLKETRIVGTHDSCSFSIVMAGDEYSVTQNTDLYHQLMGGCRFLDIRVGDWPGVSGLRTGHGIQYGDKFEDIMIQVTKFINENPEEIIIINLERCGYGMEDHQKETVKRYVDSLGSKVLKSADKWFSFNTSTLGQLWENSKTIIFLVEDKIRDLFKTAEDIGMWSTNNYYTRDTSTSFEEPLRESLNRLVISSQDNGSTSDSLVVYSYCLTPFEGSMEDVQILTNGIQRHHGLFEWTTSQDDKKLNIIILDFIYGTKTHFYLKDAQNFINSNFKSILKGSNKSDEPKQISPVSSDQAKSRFCSC